MRKVSWSSKAKTDQLDILNFWRYHNRSNVYSQQLRREFKKATIALTENPNLGTQSEIENVRMKLVRDYWIFYSYSDTEISIIQIKSTHQDPELFFKDI